MVVAKKKKKKKIRPQYGWSPIQVLTPPERAELQSWLSPVTVLGYNSLKTYSSVLY